MDGVLSEDTAAALYVVSHHTAQYGMISFPQFLEVAHQHQVPVVVDAAAEYSFEQFIEARADLVTCKGKGLSPKP
ncbi:MAG: hypothetical protein ACLFN4_06480 [Candidatus Acetothermia bacterium]